MFSLLLPPPLDDKPCSLEARKFWAVLMGTLVSLNVCIPLLMLLTKGLVLRYAIILVLLNLLGLGGLMLMRSGRIRLSSWLMLYLYQGLQLYAVWNHGGTDAPGMALSLIFVVLAGILLGARAALWVGLSSIAMTGIVAWADLHGMLPDNSFNIKPLTRWMAQAFYIGILVVIQFVLAWVLRRNEAELARSKRATEAAEQSLREHQAIHHQMYETSMDAYVRFDMAGRVLEFNEVFRRMLGFSREELRLLSHAELTPPHWLAKDRAFVREQVLARGYSDIYQKEFLRKDGSVVAVELRLSLLRGESGVPACTWAFVRDISERRNVESRLRESEEKFSKAFRYAPVLVSITTLEEGVYLDVNDYCLPLTGYQREELIGRRSVEVGWVAAEDRQRLLRHLQDDDHSSGLELVLTAKDGRKVHGLVQAEQMEFKGHSCLLCVTIDMTERKQLEEQYRQAQKMDAFGQLAGGVAHDFNNILTASMMQLSLLLSEPDLLPVMKGGLENLRTLNSRASRLTRQLLTFSRRQPVRMSELDLRELLRNLSTMLGHLIGEHMQIEERFDQGAHWVKADAGMLEQLVTNLVVNARDAMQPLGGLITLGLDFVVLTPGEALPSLKSRPGSFVRLSVRDTGCGMSEEVQRKLFEPFFTTKEVGKGTGLGLATVFGIVQQHGGWIDVRSAPGRGSEFQVWLPQIVPPERSREVAGHAPLQRGHETLLVVEDDPLVRSATVAGLRACGYEVLTAANGPEALLAWERSKECIALLLTDVVMPEGINGIELALHLRGESPGLKVIFVSGYSREFNEQGRNRVSEAEYLSKPFELHQLTQLLRRVLGPS